MIPDTPRSLTLVKEPLQAKPLYPAGRTPSPDELADHAPWLLEGARQVLETKDMLGKGRWYAAELAKFAAFLEAYAVQWEKERREERQPK